MRQQQLPFGDPSRTASQRRCDCGGKRRVDRARHRPRRLIVVVAARVRPRRASICRACYRKPPAATAVADVSIQRRGCPVSGGASAADDGASRQRSSHHPSSPHYLAGDGIGLALASIAGDDWSSSRASPIAGCLCRRKTVPPGPLTPEPAAGCAPAHERPPSPYRLEPMFTDAAAQPWSFRPTGRARASAVCRRLHVPLTTEAALPKRRPNGRDDVFHRGAERNVLHRREVVAEPERDESRLR